MKNSILLIFVLFILFSCYSVERNCPPFHTGTFEFTSIINGAIETSTFIRNDSIEIEYYKGKADTATIRWVNACECVLTKLNPATNQEKKPVQIRILKTEKKSYTFEYSLVGDSKNKQRGTITKIN